MPTIGLAQLSVSGHDGQAKAVEMFNRAQLHGDVHLEKALVTAAYANGWTQVLDLYAVKHPDTQSKIDELAATKKLEDNFNYQAHFYFSPPPELRQAGKHHRNTRTMGQWA